jgi:hypothetical protein
LSFIKSRGIPMIITFIVGILMIISYYFGSSVVALKDASTVVQKWTVIVAAFALIIGLVNISRIHVNHIIRRTKGQWIFSLWCLAIMYIMLAVGLLGTTKHPGYQWLYTWVFLPIDATMYSSLAFFISSAAYRAFKARNIESAIMLVSGIVVMLMNAPIGTIIWQGFPIIGSWIMKTPVVGAQRAFMITFVLGTVAIGIRTLLGMERGYLGREEE